MKVAIIGHFAINQEYKDGQTIKVRNLYNELEKEVGENNILKVDTYNYKKHPIKLIMKCIKAMNADNVIFLPAQNGIKVFIPLLCFLNKFYRKNLLYDVVGGWLPDLLEKNKFLLRKAKKITKIFVETNGMKTKLNSLGLENVQVMLNFKELSPIKEDEITKIDYTEINVCTFSRVIKEKGIENAINVVKKINEKYGKNIYHLDIYGQIGKDYKEDFEKIIDSINNENICYKGEIESSKSVETIKKYDLLLFPTYYEGEGLAGTIIDAFFAGVPIIASDWKYNKEIINNEVTGLIFKAKDDNDFEEMLDDIYLQKYDINQMKIECLKESEKYLPQIAIKPVMEYIDAPQRLLCIVSGMNRGGAETFLMKVYRALDKNKYQMDFCVNTEGAYDKEIREMGGKIFFVPPKSKNLLKTFFAIKRIVKENKYKSVLRTSQQSLATLDLLSAKMGGAKKLIYRSSNAGLTGGKISKLINKTFSFLPKVIPNVKVAPSTEAAEFVFGKKSVEKNEVFILHNALKYENFKFNEEARERIRKELNIDNKLVYGHIGRFNIQKNHEFLIEVFKRIHEKEQNSVLILIGEGELKQKILDKIKELNIENSVIVLEPKQNVNEYMMAMDLFIFPSFFEGMPNVIIEAQATGLPCVISDSITKEANITGSVKYISLDNEAEYWADTILDNMPDKRYDYYEEFLKNGYCIEDVCNLVCKSFFI